MPLGAEGSGVTEVSALSLSGLEEGRLTRKHLTGRTPLGKRRWRQG